MEFYLALQAYDFVTSLAMPVGAGQAIKNTELLDSSDSAFSSIIHIECTYPSGSSGSGVVIAKRSTSIFIDGREYTSLALTAGHVIGKSINISPSSNAMVQNPLSLSPSQAEYATVLNDYSDIKSMPQLDPVSGIPYALPNDLGLLALPKMFETRIEPMTISDVIQPDDQFFIAGYPLEPPSILYCSPCLKTCPESVYRQKIFNAFCGFENKVFSYGSAKNLRIEDQYLLAVNYSATSGMSGSPIYIRRNGIPYLAGINLGGCSLPYQSEIAIIINEIISGNTAKASVMIDTLNAEIIASPLFDYGEISEYFNMIKQVSIAGNREIVVCVLKKLLKMLPLGYTKPLELAHNLSLPVWSPLFNEIKKVIRNFNAMPPSERFHTSKHFFIELSK